MNILGTRDLLAAATHNISNRSATRLIGLLLATTASPAFAQSAGSTAASANQPAASTAAESAAPEADSNSGLKEIVVTATKRETNLQKTPIAISVLSNEEMKKRHVESLYDLADGAIPSLRVATFEARQSALTVGIRGIVPLDANQPAREQGVGIYLDGIYLGRQHGLNAALFDVERIEVLKGPQGTLFGRNTEGGALSIVTRAPRGEFALRGLGGVGNYGSYNGELHLDLPAFANIAIKADGVIQHQDATTKNPMPGQTGWNYYDRQGLRIAARWRPIKGLTDDFAFDIARDANTPFYSQLLNYNPNGCVAGPAPAPSESVRPGACYLPGTAYTSLTGTVKPLMPGVIVEGDHRMKRADIGVPQQPSIDKTHGFSNIFKYQFSPAFEFRSITAWRSVDATQWDNSGGAHRVPVIQNLAGCTSATPTSSCLFSRYSLADLHQDQFSQEFQGVGSVGRFDYVAGLYYFNEHVSDDAATPNSKGVIATVNPLSPTTVTGVTYVDVPFCTASTPLFAGEAVNGCSIDRASRVTSKSYAAYGQLTFNPTDRLHLTAGARYTHDVKKGELLFFRNVNYQTNPVTAALNGYHPLDKTWNRFNPMATIAYDFSNSLHGYAKYSTGYRAGGASSRTANYQPFDPEDIRAYEVGLKSDFWDHRARLNLAAYAMNRKNSQVDISFIQPAAGSNVNVLNTINAPGITKIRGFEADLTLRPIDNLQLSASYAYTHTRIPLVPITYTAGGLSTTVDQRFFIVFTPRNAASGAIDYDLPVGGSGAEVRFHVDANYAQATQAFDQFATKADSSFIVNGRVSLADLKMNSDESRVTVSVWARNLLDEQHVFRRDPSNSLPGAPTTSVTTGSINNVLGDYGNFNPPRTFGVEVAFKVDPPRRAAPYIAPPAPPPPPAVAPPATQTCAEGSEILATDVCPPPPPAPSAPERG